VERLSELEGECVQKDDLIVQMREEVTNLQNFLRHIEVDRCPMCQDNTMQSILKPAAPVRNAIYFSFFGLHFKNLCSNLYLSIFVRFQIHYCEFSFLFSMSE